MSEREAISKNFKLAADELEMAAAHYKIASKRFLADDVPAGCAHAFASKGHIAKAETLIEENSVIHSSFAEIKE